MKALFLTFTLLPLAATASAQVPAPPPPAPAIATPAPPKTYATVRVVLTTSLGPITVLLEKERAPITSANFLRYVDQKRYDGISFFRRSQAPGEPTKGFVQAGTTDPKRILPPIAHEPTTKTGLSHIDGALSAPRFAPGTARGDFTIRSIPVTGMSMARAAATAARIRAGCTSSVTSWMVPPRCRLAAFRTRTSSPS